MTKTIALLAVLILAGCAQVAPQPETPWTAGSFWQSMADNSAGDGGSDSGSDAE